MNKKYHFNKLLQNGKFAALAIDQGTSLKNISTCELIQNST